MGPSVSVLMYSNTLGAKVGCTVRPGQTTELCLRCVKGWVQLIPGRCNLCGTIAPAGKCTYLWSMNGAQTLYTRKYTRGVAQPRLPAGNLQLQALRYCIGQVGQHTNRSSSSSSKYAPSWPLATPADPTLLVSLVRAHASSQTASSTTQYTRQATMPYACCTERVQVLMQPSQAAPNNPMRDPTASKMGCHDMYTY
jgi:hypothetical protein